jgi:hypothetical protein
MNNVQKLFVLNFILFLNIVQGNVADEGLLTVRPWCLEGEICVYFWAE